MNCEPLLSLFLPRRCVICDKRLGKGEEHICAGCLTTLIHPTLLDPTDNEVARRIWGFHTIRAGVTLYYYKRGSEAHQLLQAMKYRGRIDVCKSMGRMLASTFTDSGFFDTIDAIVPIPLSKARRRWRGYNQASHIAQGISKVTGIPILEKALARVKDNETQTHQNYTQRVENVKDIFAVEKQLPIDGKHLLIIDDVITTGATLHSAIATLSKAYPKATFSVASIALTIE